MTKEVTHMAIVGLAVLAALVWLVVASGDAPGPVPTDDLVRSATKDLIANPWSPSPMFLSIPASAEEDKYEHRVVTVIGASLRDRPDAWTRIDSALAVGSVLSGLDLSRTWHQGEGCSFSVVALSTNTGNWWVGFVVDLVTREVVGVRLFAPTDRDYASANARCAVEVRHVGGTALDEPLRAWVHNNKDVLDAELEDQRNAKRYAAEARAAERAKSLDGLLDLPGVGRR